MISLHNPTAVNGNNNWENWAWPWAVFAMQPLARLVLTCRWVPQLALTDSLPYAPPYLALLVTDLHASWLAPPTEHHAKLAARMPSLNDLEQHSSKG